MSSTLEMTPAGTRRPAWKAALAIVAVVPAVAVLGWTQGATRASAQSDAVSPAAAQPVAPPVQQVVPAEAMPVAGAISVPGRTLASVDYFLKLDGIDGDVTERGLEGAIHIESFSWGVSQQGTHGGGGGGGAGKVSMQDLHFVMSSGKASPMLFRACAQGQHIKKAVLYVRKAGGGQQDYLVVTFEDLLVSSFQSSGADGSLPMEEVSLNFSRAMFTVDASPPDIGR